MSFLRAHSFCIATNQAECRYRPRRTRRSLPSGNDHDDATRVLPPPASGGRIFRPTDGENTPALTGAGGRFTLAGSRSGVGRLLLPFERCVAWAIRGRGTLLPFLIWRVDRSVSFMDNVLSCGCVLVLECASHIVQPSVLQLQPVPSTNSAKAQLDQLFTSARRVKF